MRGRRPCCRAPEAPGLRFAEAADRRRSFADNGDDAISFQQGVSPTLDLFCACGQQPLLVPGFELPEPVREHALEQGCFSLDPALDSALDSALDPALGQSFSQSLSQSLS